MSQAGRFEDVGEETRFSDDSMLATAAGTRTRQLVQKLARHGSLG